MQALRGKPLTPRRVEELTGKPELLNEDAEGAGRIYEIKFPNSTRLWIGKLISLPCESRVEVPRIKP